MSGIADPGGRGTPGASRRRLFGSRTGSPSTLDPALAGEIEGVHRSMMTRFERGLAELEESARSRMAAVAEEAWQGTEAELRELRERILRELSRDQAIRGLIAHADERYQSLDVRVERMERNLSGVESAARALTGALGEAASGENGPELLTLVTLDQRLGGMETTLQSIDGRIDSRVGDAMQTTLESIDRTSRELHERLEDGILTVRTAVTELQAGVPVGAGGEAAPAYDVDLGPVAERLHAVQEYLGQVVEYLSARDRAIVEWVQTATAHTDGLVREESERVMEALGGRLDRTSQAIETLGARMDVEARETEERLREAVAVQLQGVHDRLRHHAQVLGEALAAVEARTLAGLEEQDATMQDQAERLEAVRAQVEAARAAAVEATGRVSDALHERLADIVDQMRAESEDMRVRLVERAQQAGADATRDIDERLARMAELTQAALGWTVDEIEQRVQREILRSVEVGMADFIAAMDRRFVQLHESLDERVTFLSRSVDGHIDLVQRRMDEQLERTDRAMRAGLGALEESIIERSTQAVEGLVDTKLVPATGEVQRAVESARRGLEEHVTRATSFAVETAKRSLEETLIQATTSAVESARRGLEESLTRAVSERITALAQLIRSDNTALAGRLVVVEEQAAAKEAIRAIKELAAALPQEISEAMDERLAVLGEHIRRENRTTVESVAKAATALADRLDRTAIIIGERFDRDVEVVVDQIGTTMQTLATGLQRSTGRNRPA
ncbi:MAG TPA: hypothetical protein VGB19_09860 [Actinomycetota bacterium]